MNDVIVDAAEIDRRTIRKSDWVACNAAFIDCRTPGSDQKENYSFIGVGVSQSASQYINLTEQHGFNARGLQALPEIAQAGLALFRPDGGRRRSRLADHVPLRWIEYRIRSCSSGTERQGGSPWS